MTQGLIITLFDDDLTMIARETYLNSSFYFNTQESVYYLLKYLY